MLGSCEMVLGTGTSLPRLAGEEDVSEDVSDGLVGFPVKDPYSVESRDRHGALLR